MNELMIFFNEVNSVGGTTIIQDANITLRSFDTGVPYENVFRTNFNGSLDFIKPPAVMGELRKNGVSYEYTRAQRGIESAISYHKQITDTGATQGILDIGEDKYLGWEILTGESSTSAYTHNLAVANMGFGDRIKLINNDWEEFTLSNKTSRQSGDFAISCVSFCTGWPIASDETKNQRIELQSICSPVFTTPHLIAYAFKIGALTKREALEAFKNIEHYYNGLNTIYIRRSFNRCIEKLQSTTSS